ncbi:MAG TPA: protein kinase [Pyrinomonadaceae bacterium]|nr:protein kinase [Pyrinomonadaceae bacterium]
MTPERWQQISRIFKLAISLDSEARADYVKNQCGVDESLREEVEKLIDSHKKASDDKFIEGVAAEENAELLVGEDELNEQRPRLSKGQHLGSYVVLDTLGTGGMGEVYQAKDSRLGRTVALKVLSEDIASDKRRMQRFRQEAKIASSLNQPNILTIFEFGEIEGLTFLATEFIDGETLRDSLRARKLEIAEVIDIAIQVLAALDAAHDARIVHRDIKPENVMIRRRDSVVKVLDFGLAKVAERKQSMLSDQYSELEAATEFKTAPHTVMGTVNYMSPEQTQAHAVDERTDIWSTGVMIYEMVAGLVPFKGATLSHTIVQILEKDPVPLTQFRKRKAPAELQRIVAKALAKNPAERYQTANDMLIDLRTLKKRLEVEAEINRTSSTDTLRVAVTNDAADRGPQQKRVLVIALIAMAVVTAAIFAVNIWRASRTRTNQVVTSPAPAPVEQRTLAYWITVQKFRDNKPYDDPFTVAGEMIFEADYQIRMNFRSPQPGHLYVLSEGPVSASAQTQFVTLFPSSSANKGSSLLPADQEVQIPEKTWFQFDKEQGTEMLWLVFSEDAIPELEAVREFAATRTRGLITDPARNLVVQNFLNTNSTQKPTMEKDSTQTTVKIPGKLLVYPVKLEHH